MVWISFVWFLLLYAAGYLYGGRQDVFAPIKFISIKFFLLNLSFILYTALFPDSFFQSILQVCHVTLDEAFLQYTIVQTVAYLSLICGITVFSKKKHIPGSALSEPHNYRNLKILTIAFFCIGFAAYLVFLQRIGGLQYLLTHLNKRVQLQGGHYILNLMPLMSVACVFLLLAIKIRNNFWDKALLCLFAVANIAIQSSLGGRKGTLIFIITLIVALHYVVKRITVTKKTVGAFAVFGILLFGYIMAIPFLRGPKAKSDNIVEAYKSVLTARKFVYNVSYVFIDVFAANYYDKDNAWYLEGYFAPTGALFAKGDKSSIPQVDQGVYFKSITRWKKDFRPPMPRNKVSKKSWPTENFGFAYANFLMPGILVFFFLQGAIFAIGYNILKYRYSNPLLVMFYVLLIFEFNFSSLNLAFFVKTLPLMYLCYIVFNKFVLSKKLLQSLSVKL